jgi:hypothetical protein
MGTEACTTFGLFRRRKKDMNHFGKRDGLIASSACFFLQGGWAAYANHAYGWERSLLSGAVQGAASFGMTFLVTGMLEMCLARFAGWQPVYRLLASVVLAVAGMISVLVGLHWIGGTPNILLTIALPVGMGSIYCIAYGVGRIWRDKKREQPATSNP